MREVLPNRHWNVSFSFDHNGQHYAGMAGFYQDWRLGEVFLDGSKSGTQLQNMINAAAIAASLAIQYGCPVNVLAHALPKLEDGTAADPLGKLLELLNTIMLKAAE